MFSWEQSCYCTILLLQDLEPYQSQSDCQFPTAFSYVSRLSRSPHYPPFMAGDLFLTSWQFLGLQHESRGAMGRAATPARVTSTTFPNGHTAQRHPMLVRAGSLPQHRNPESKPSFKPMS